MTQRLVDGLKPEVSFVLGALSAIQDSIERGDTERGMAEDVEVIITKSDEYWFTIDVSKFTKEMSFKAKKQVTESLSTLMDLGLIYGAELGKDWYYRVNFPRVEELYYGGKPTSPKRK